MKYQRPTLKKGNDLISLSNASSNENNTCLNIENFNEKHIEATILNPTIKKRLTAMVASFSIYHKKNSN